MGKRKGQQQRGGARSNDRFDERNAKARDRQTKRELRAQRQRRQYGVRSRLDIRGRRLAWRNSRPALALVLSFSLINAFLPFNYD